jgi:hypothetical protein
MRCDPRDPHSACRKLDDEEHVAGHQPKQRSRKQRRNQHDQKLHAARQGK